MDRVRTGSAERTCRSGGIAGKAKRATTHDDRLAGVVVLIREQHSPQAPVGRRPQIGQRSDLHVRRATHIGQPAIGASEVDGQCVGVATTKAIHAIGAAITDHAVGQVGKPRSNGARADTGVGYVAD